MQFRCPACLWTGQRKRDTGKCCPKCCADVITADAYQEKQALKWKAEAALRKTRGPVTTIFCDDDDDYPVPGEEWDDRRILPPIRPAPAVLSMRVIDTGKTLYFKIPGSAWPKRKRR